MAKSQPLRHQILLGQQSAVLLLRFLFLHRAKRAWNETIEDMSEVVGMWANGIVETSIQTCHHACAEPRRFKRKQKRFIDSLLA